MNHKTVEYERLAEDGNENPTQFRRKGLPLIVKILLALLIFLFTLLLGAVFGSLRHFQSYWQRHPKITHCGRTSSEARARGCVLEPMVYGWMPPHCQFPEFSKNYEPFEKWQWYADENMTQSLTEEQLWRGESIDLWTNISGYHTEHCLFLYGKLMYAVDNNLPWLDKKTLGSHHAYHCIGQLRSSTEEWNATTWTGLGMYTCERTPWS